MTLPLDQHQYFILTTNKTNVVSYPNFTQSIVIIQYQGSAFNSSFITKCKVMMVLRGSKKSPSTYSYLAPQL